MTERNRFTSPECIKNAPLLYELAEELVNDPKLLQIYDSAKWNLTGDADPRERYAGRHPLPEWKGEDDKRRVGTIPVSQTVNAETATLLSIYKDDWVSPDKPDAWYVREVDLHTGKVKERPVLTASVDGLNQMTLRLKDKNLAGWPPGRNPADLAPLRDAEHITADLDEMYHAGTADWHFGSRNTESYEDIVMLESMIRMVQDLQTEREAEEPQKHYEKICRGLGMQATVFYLPPQKTKELAA